MRSSTRLEHKSKAVAILINLFRPDPKNVVDCIWLNFPIVSFVLQGRKSQKRCIGTSFLFPV
jgi:hypothetical protein